MKPQRGWTLVELLVALAIVGILMSLLIPAVLMARAAARRGQCGSRVRQIGLALAQYESAHQVFPPGRMTPDYIKRGQLLTEYTNYSDVSQSARSGDRTGFRSVHLFLLPFLERQNVYDMIDFDRPGAHRMTRNGQPYNVNYAAYATAHDLFLCPADANTGRVISENNFRYNFGGSTPYAGAQDTRHQTSHRAQLGRLSCSGNGAFTIGRALRATLFRDGLSSTVVFSERTKGSGGRASRTPPEPEDLVTMPRRSDSMLAPDEMLQRCASYRPRPSPFNFTAAGRWLPGSDYSNGWPFASYASTMYNHVAPPNWSGQDCGSYSAIPDTPGEHAIVSARSDHAGGVNALFGDGHTRFIRDTIRLDVWRALGTRAGQESIDFRD